MRKRRKMEAKGNLKRGRRRRTKKIMRKRRRRKPKDK